MAQQFHNGGLHKGSYTISKRDSDRYAVIGEPWSTVARKFGSATSKSYEAYCRARKARWAVRNMYGRRV